MSSIDIWVGEGKRARLLCGILAQYFTRARIPFAMLEAEKYHQPVNSVAVFYGLAGKLRQVYRDYTAIGRTTVLIDLGYWGRHDGGRLAGYHRVAVNALHSTRYFQKVKHAPDRVARFALNVQPWRKPAQYEPILICGQSEKAAWVYDLAPDEWEIRAAEELAKVTDRSIWYRPKPTRAGRSAIPGALSIGVADPLEKVLASGVWAVVTHHSNAGIDALVAGVPVLTVDGIAEACGTRGWGQIEHPYCPTDAERRQFLSDAAYVQWNVEEIGNGSMWRHLQSEGLVP